MTRDEIIRMAREAGAEFYAETLCVNGKDAHDFIERFAALVAAHAKSDQINTAYQQGCEDMKRRMEKRMQQLESQLQLCQTAVAAEREACAKVCEEVEMRFGRDGDDLEQYGANQCAAAIRARGEK